MTLELVSEEVPSAYLSTLYPFNALRNHALLLVRTEVTPICCCLHASFAVSSSSCHINNLPCCAVLLTLKNPPLAASAVVLSDAVVYTWYA